ncbi:alkaline shock response membrane anchor protein AmaP [Crassaminicella profunda]|uniref:alkaline shock response membrane anchor protein AmaP n=1 Tax=Crassaminicella profunda TaxID=1286698 RepID=UPI001CA75B52|nr:alkaline shock response membrane anchor protein AmaP [Crassaminicella profunda]QZY56961.1 alkaline shock response membrane anchor protein AmaP [Crassaminicella profunda]
MKLIDRIFLSLYSLCIAILSLVFIIAPFNNWLYTWTSYILKVYRMNWEYMIIPVIFLLISMRFLFSGSKKNHLKSNSIIKHTSYGEVKITMETIENMAHKCAKAVHGLRDIKALSHDSHDGLIITIKAFALSDINIPETAMTIQKKIKEHIEETTGVVVKEVKITIDNIASQNKKRVQ